MTQSGHLFCFPCPGEQFHPTTFAVVLRSRIALLGLIGFASNALLALAECRWILRAGVRLLIAILLFLQLCQLPL
jgi:hypothetical protein